MLEVIARLVTCIFVPTWTCNLPTSVSGRPRGCSGGWHPFLLVHFVLTLFGGVTDFVNELNSDTWKQMMFCIACHLLKMYNDFRVVLLHNKFNFGQ